MESLAAMKSTGTRIGDEVYVSAVALRATKGPAQLIMSSAYSLNLWDLQHFMVLVKPYPSHLSQVLVFDFQPEDPENIFVGLTALSGGSIKGSVFRRKLGRLPKRKCWFVGHSIVDDIMTTTEDVINKFNESWETELKIGHHDCRHYTNELVKCLTGEENVLERLRTDHIPQKTIH